MNLYLNFLDSNQKLLYNYHLVNNLYCMNFPILLYNSSFISFKSIIFFCIFISLFILLFSVLIFIFFLSLTIFDSFCSGKAISF